MRMLARGTVTEPSVGVKSESALLSGMRAERPRPRAVRLFSVIGASGSRIGVSATEDRVCELSICLCTFGGSVVLIDCFTE